MSETNRQLSVSEQLLQLHLANFKLDLFKELTTTYATIAQLKDLTVDVNKWQNDMEPRVRRLEDGQVGSLASSSTKKRLADMAFALACAVVGALVYLVVSGTGVH